MPMVPAEFETERGRSALVSLFLAVFARGPGRGHPRRRHPERAAGHPSQDRAPRLGSTSGRQTMKIKNSLKSLRTRHRDNRLVRRKGRVYIINKTNPRFKARQG